MTLLFIPANDLLRISINVIASVTTIGSYPNTLSSKYTIPHLLTVAGDATAKSNTSKIILIYVFNFIRSPLLKHNVIESSKTVFIFSIHNASTGPSNTTHFFSNVSYDAYPLIIFDAKPSVHYYVIISNYPYSSSIDIAFGFKI